MIDDDRQAEITEDYLKLRALTNENFYNTPKMYWTRLNEAKTSRKHHSGTQFTFWKREQICFTNNCLT